MFTLLLILYNNFNLLMVAKLNSYDTFIKKNLSFEPFCAHLHSKFRKSFNIKQKFFKNINIQFGYQKCRQD
jgi:hypothetical protein